MLSAPSAVPRGASTEEQPLAGVHLKVSLECPSCRQTGWVYWGRLQSGLRCPACDCRFRLGQDGRFQAQRSIPQLRFCCPRCRLVASVSAAIALRGTHCASCGLALFLGPERKLYDASELAEARRKARQATWSARLKQHTAKALREGMPCRGTALAVFGITILLAVALGSFALRGLMIRPSAEAACEAFTRRCLKGDWDAALAYIADDDHQRMEFERWRILQFASIVDRVRPGGDRVTLKVTSMPTRDARITLHVRLRSPFIGARDQKQCWYAQEGRYWFDAVETLAGD